MEGSDILQDILVDQYDGSMLDLSYMEEDGGYVMEFFLDIASLGEEQQFLRHLESQVKQKFILGSTAKGASYYYCHLSKKYKGKHPTQTKKTDCEAKLTMRRLGMEEAGAKGWPYQCRVKMDSRHNHALQSADALRKLSAGSEIREAFFSLFARGETPSSAIGVFKAQLKDDPFYTDTWLQDGTKFPRMTVVDWWFRCYKHESWGTSSSDYQQKLKERSDKVLDQGYTLEVLPTPHVGCVIITPIMRRAHSFHWAGEMIFMDSTSSCDNEQTTVTMLSAMQAKTGLTAPLGILLTQGQSLNIYSLALQAMDKALNSLPTKWGGQPYPHLFMVDHAQAEIGAIKSVYPNSGIILCSWHISAAVGRNLSKASRSVAPKDQLHFQAIFKKAQTTLHQQEAVDEFRHLLNETVRLGYQDLYEYFKDIYEADLTMWAEAYRSFHCRGNNTNNRSENNMLVIKTQVMERLRTYNVVALADWMIQRLDNAFRSRFLNFANGEISAGIRSIRNNLSNLQSVASCIPRRHVIGNPTNITVRSQTTLGVKYNVDLLYEHCSCHAGFHGEPCKHLYRAADLNNVTLLWLKEYSQDTRYEAAVLAQGRGATSYATYAPMKQQGPNPPGNGAGGSTPSPYAASPYNNQQSPKPVAAALPPTPRQDARFQAMADDIGDELKRCMALNSAGNDFNSAYNDAAQLLSSLKKIKTAGQAQAFFRSKGKVTKRTFHRLGRIRVNRQAIIRRKSGKGTSRPMPKGSGPGYSHIPYPLQFVARQKRVTAQKAAAAALKKAKRKLNFG